ncbi:DUF2332 domain-containing protein [Saccharothrix sp. ST-888]|uniref:DUF2332 domain-containing protein n=1 Tax=Saccharothrix sp. ST-888 TaxID=1427391 RepID=UPI0005ECDC0F|nr:DUF2332 domain-containing protein [Saccharothrix sp. ST-888]KJK58154.1 hypothetical protein UK12_12185 [Saccharothrix sp. ST-888]
MPVEHAVAMIGLQADACENLGSPLYAALLRRVAQDVRDGGPCADAIAGYEDAPGPDAIALRLLGGIHALVLTGRAPELAVHYPSVGGSFAPEALDKAWAAFRATVAAELPRVRDWMTRPPQTNEVGRANLLITGLLHTLARHPLPVRLFELGSSAGLNLLADRFHYRSTGFAYGPEDSPVLLPDAWRDTPPAWLTGPQPTVAFTERRGCDLTPIDPVSAEGSLALRAYLWADQPARTARLNGALRLATGTPAPVDPVGAAEFLAGVEPAAGALTVVWHSIMRQYVPAGEWAGVEAGLQRLASASTADAPFAHIAFEPRRVGDRHRFQLTVRTGADFTVEQVLAEAMPHGLPAWLPTA